MRATVLLGILNRKYPGPHSVRIDVTKDQMYIHKGFDHIENYNDLALIHLNKPIVFNGNFNIIMVKIANNF